MYDACFKNRITTKIFKISKHDRIENIYLVKEKVVLVYNDTIELWDFSTGRQIFSYEPPQTLFLYAKLVLYKGENVLAVSTDGNSLEYHRLDDQLTSFLILDDSLDIVIRNLQASPCRRILVVEEKRAISIYDTMNGCKVHSIDC
jgi:WD40 repeat protein